MQVVTLEELQKSQLYSEELGISLAGRKDEELFKWFLASILMGARESEIEGQKTYKTFEKYELLSPYPIVEAGVDFLVKTVLRESSSLPDDTKTAGDIMSTSNMLMKDYGGSLNLLHDQAGDEEDLQSDLLKFYGIGPHTLNMFLRELRPHWPKDNIEPIQAVKDLARENGIDLTRFDKKDVIFTRIEAGLVRLRRYTSHRPGLAV